MIKKFILLLLTFYLIIPASSAEETVSKVNIYKKYNKEVQKSINRLPKINEASMGNLQLVVRSKNNNYEKWKNNYYPFYWTAVGRIDLENSYITVQADKSNFAESKYFLNTLEYLKDYLIIGFIKTNILKNSKTRKKIIGFKYNLNNAVKENDKSWHAANLELIILIDIDSKNHKYMQFI